MFGQFGVLGRLTPEDEHEYWMGTNSARWVFGKEMDKFLKVELWGAIADYIAAQNNYNEHADTKMRSELAVAKAQRRKELLALRDKADERFAEFMEFEREPTFE